MKLRIALLLSALSGFIGLSYEIVWIRIYSMVSWGKASAFGALLGSYLAGLAIGALIARRYCRESGHRELRALAMFVLAANVLGFLLVPAMAELVRFAPYYWALPLVALASAMLGTTFPLIAHFGVPPDERVGARVSYLYGANILGSTCGSLLTGFVLFDVMPLQSLCLLLALIGLGIALGVARLDGDWRRRRGGYIATAVVAAAAVIATTPLLFDALYERMQFKDEYKPGERFALVVEGKSGVVTVTKDGVVFGGGVYDGRFNTDPVNDTNGIFRAYAPFAFRREAGDVLVVGAGSGSWAQVIASHPSCRRMVIIEISSDYLEVIGSSPIVSSLLENPKVEFVIDDGRRWLNRHAEKFDWIIQNTTYHFRAHATNLLSREYLQLVREHLKPGGVFVYNTTRSEDAQRTGAMEFPHAWLIDNSMVVSDMPLERDLAAWRRTLLDYEVDGRKIFVARRKGDFEALARMLSDERWLDRDAVLEKTRDAVVITDDNMASEWGHLR